MHMIRGEIIGALELIQFEIKTTDDEKDLWDLIGVIDELKIKAVNKLQKVVKTNRAIPKEE